MGCCQNSNARTTRSASFRADMEWWHVFAEKWNGVSMLRDVAFWSPSVEIWSDASGSWGCGAVWGAQWFQVWWSDWPGFSGASLSAVHVPGIENGVADSISRNNLPLFFNLLPQAHPTPCKVLEGLVNHLIRERPWTSKDWSTWLGTLLMTH